MAEGRKKFSSCLRAYEYVQEETEEFKGPTLCDRDDLPQDHVNSPNPSPDSLSNDLFLPDMYLSTYAAVCLASERRHICTRSYLNEQ